jgi:hypothetical protein
MANRKRKNKTEKNRLGRKRHRTRQGGREGGKNEERKNMGIN